MNIEIDFKNIINKDTVLKSAALIGERNNTNVYVVGGFVRDLILKREIREADLLVIGNGPEFAKELANELSIKNITIYRNFGTAQFVNGNMSYEFVGSRKESYNRNSRNPIIDVGTFEDDIYRRDFTVNTLALSLNKDDYCSIIDTFDGLRDLQDKIIKTPLDPLKTFDDDPLRIMRAFRFAAQLEFEVDHKIINAAKKMAERLKIVAQERITDEFLKILSAPKPSVGLKLMYDSGVMDIVFPEISDLKGVDQRKDFHHKDVFLHTCKVVDNIATETNDLWLRFAALVHDIAKPATKKFIEGIGWTFHGHEELGARMMKTIFRRMKLPFNKLDYIRKLIRLHLRPIALVDETVTDSAIRRLIVQADEDLDDLITLCRADITSKNPQKVSKYLNNYEIVMRKVKEVREKDKLRAFQSPVRGDEIMRVFEIPPSKKVGIIKSAIEEAILEGTIRNNYEEAYDYMIELKKKNIFKE